MKGVGAGTCIGRIRYSRGGENIKTLIDLAKQDNQRAFTSLFNIYYPIVYRLTKNIVKDDEISKDLSIESITKAFKKIQKYEKDVSFELWLKRITNNHVIDYIRSGYLKNNNISIDDEQLKNLHYTDYSNPEKDYIKREVKTIFDNEMDLLRGKTKQILDLRFRDELTYQKIADKLNISIGTVKNIISTQKTKITKKLKNNEHLSKDVRSNKIAS